jgi:hypothetical protein
VEFPQIRAHIGGMTSATPTTVYYTSKECGMTYTATQEQRPEGHSGKFDCVDCGKTVLEWTGFHRFSDWEPVTTRPAGPGTKP